MFGSNRKIGYKATDKIDLGNQFKDMRENKDIESISVCLWRNSDFKELNPSDVNLNLSASSFYNI